MNGATPTTQDTPDKGRLQINLVSDITAYPIQGARISISYTGIPETPLEQLTTDSSGQTDMIDLAAPPLEYSLDPENEIQPTIESGEIVLSRVVVPEYIVVHDGSPRDSTARNYYVKYKDYIKNVASSEIYATWPEDTIRANVLAIMSFTLNRV